MKYTSIPSAVFDDMMMALLRAYRDIPLEERETMSVSDVAYAEGQRDLAREIMDLMRSCEVEK